MASLFSTSSLNVTVPIGGLADVFSAVKASVVAQGGHTREIGVGSEEVAMLAQKVRTSAGRMQAMGGSIKAMTVAAEQAVDAARGAFERLTDRAGIVLRQADTECDGAGERWPVELHGTIFVSRGSLAIQVIDISLAALQIKTEPDFPVSCLGDTMDVKIETLGRFAIKLLTPSAFGFEAIIVDPPAGVRSRIAAETRRLSVLYLPYIERVQAVAIEIDAAVESALESGTIREADLFDSAYKRDGEAEPAQYMNAAVAPLEAHTRAIIERERLTQPAPDFCMLQDRNGFNPIHNLCYSRPARRGDSVWNLRHSRMRRIFDDRVGMGASRNLKPFLVQSYARDMGDAIEVRMEFDAPLFFHDRHWGAVRMAYKLR